MENTENAKVKKKLSISVLTIIEIVILMNIGDMILDILGLPSFILLIAGIILVFVNTIRMEQPDEKDEIWLAVMQIVAYVIFVSFADKQSEEYNIPGLFTMSACTVLLIMYLIYINKHSLKKYYGLCKPDCHMGNFLLFIPLIATATVNIWGGLEITLPIAETIMLILAKALAGISEEFVFRGFLFKAISRTSKKRAIIISSLTFGIGHIVNLVLGKDPVSTLIQIMYAIAIGFMLAAILVKTGSIIPGILFHGFINGTSAIRKDSPYTLIFCIIITVICAGYAIYLFKTIPDKEEATV